MELVRRICIWGHYENTETNKLTKLTYGFDLESLVEEDIIDPHLLQFGDEQEAGPSQCVVMEYGTSLDDDKKSLVCGYSPCSFTDEPNETLISARKKVKDMTSSFRDFIISKGFACKKITKGE